MFEQYHNSSRCFSLQSHPKNNAANNNLLIGLHGWLDNARSFQCLMEQLPQYSWLALDMPGHGRSAWLAGGADYSAWSYCLDVAKVINEASAELNKNNSSIDSLPGVNLVCHSMGATTGILLAASQCLPIRSLIFLDSVGPMVDLPEQQPGYFAKGLKARLALSKQQFEYSQGNIKARFSDIDEAVEKYRAKHPQYEHEMLTPLLSRNLKAVDGGYGWSTDPRIKQLSLLRFTENQVRAFCESIDVPVLIVRANSSFIPKDFFQKRLDYFSNVSFVELDGHHHFHLDKNTVNALASSINEFIAGLSQ